MIKHKRIGLLAALLMAAAVLFLSIGYFAPEAFGAVTGSAEFPYVSAMDKTKVLDVQIVADEQAWANMLENATAEEYISATIIINGTKIKNVGIRPKGNSSLSMVAQDDTTDRYSFKIEFDHYVSGQTWLGLDKLVVNNMQGDATYMKEYLSYNLMEFAGVATPLYVFSDITVNGESWGFYLAVEALEDSYAQRVFGNDHGKLYKPESMGIRGNGRMNERIEEAQGTEEDIFPSVQEQGQMPEGDPPNPGAGGFGGGQSGGTTLQYTDDALSSYSAIFENAVFKSTDRDYARVVNALKKLNAGEDLENAVDVEATLKYFAAHTVIVNLDSYVSNMSHNYYLYEKDGQLTMLPWDFNLAFGGFQSGSASDIVNFPIDTPVSGISLEDRPMLAKLLEVPDDLELYHGYLQEIVEGYFNSGVFEQTIDLLDALIAPYVEADPSAFYAFASYQAGVAELKKLGVLRAQSIEGQLGGSIPATTAGQNANPGALVDASSINLSALGSMGGGGSGNRPAGMPNETGNGRPAGGFQGINREIMQKAMEILRAAAGEGDLSEEQLAALLELGLTEEQIDQFRSMDQAGFEGRGERPDGGRGEQERTPPGGNAGTAYPSEKSTGFDAQTWTVLGGSAILLLGGLLFVAFYQRRRSR